MLRGQRLAFTHNSSQSAVVPFLSCRGSGETAHGTGEGDRLARRERAARWRVAVTNVPAPEQKQTLPRPARPAAGACVSQVACVRVWSSCDLYGYQLADTDLKYQPVLKLLHRLITCGGPHKFVRSKPDPLIPLSSGHVPRTCRPFFDAPYKCSQYVCRRLASIYNCGSGFVPPGVTCIGNTRE